MRRALAALMALLLMLSLSACQPKDETASAKPTPIPMTDEPLEDADDSGLDETFVDESLADAAQEPAGATAPPVASGAGAATAAYVYTSTENIALGVAFKYPSDWANVSTELSVIYEETNPVGACPARMAITRRDAGKIVVTEEVGMDKLTDFRKSLKANCTAGFKYKNNKRFKFAGNVGFSFAYVGTFNDVPMKGYAAITYHKKKNCFYLFHFNAPQADYAAFDKVRKTIQKSIKI